MCWTNHRFTLLIAILGHVFGICPTVLMDGGLDAHKMIHMFSREPLPEALASDGRVPKRSTADNGRDDRFRGIAINS
jgi:hypothetical protein